ncbi:hypothetical protein PFICI_11581 [Pestalotiopsis fici W106-1]|uniref:Transmembrane protein n=1 Tax=Pestalotiopsis fici (strain W106-1 / CGMCC3.15140) TaxID=1229662 RepID=W3WQU3_PESFW|nr:uncharacterized protein PFICI_11581 [Pestalotiopsis fici W106-1]ETS76194.1 hypothetical protein PFICI_11581 [Pestalotiopsis fici W106-1]
MPRCTISRVLGLVPLTWVCLVATWFFFPSPSVPTSQRDEYIQTNLRLGGELSTIVEYSKSFKFGGNRGSRECSECDGIILDWRLESHRTTDSLLLHLGEARINLTEATLAGPKAAQPAEEQVAYLSEPFKARVRAGSIDHVTVLPWFRWTDKILINWIMYRNHEDLELRLFSPTPGVVEVWKDIAMWETWKAGVPVRDTERDVGLLASFSHLQTVQFTGAEALRANAVHTEIAHVQGQLPSKTWPIRSIIAGPLYVPTFMFSLLIWSFTFEMVPLTIVLAFQMICILAIFARADRLTISPRQCFCRDRKKRNQQHGIWGAAGPIADEENGLLALRPKKPLAMPSISKPSRSRAPVFDKM